ncbi:MAG: hypothetical protein GXZ15_03530 [Campylobacter sp.]|nr:hypothetical protein [Campylobacter sp.]
MIKALKVSIAPSSYLINDMKILNFEFVLVDCAKSNNTNNFNKLKSYTDQILSKQGI